MKEELEEIIERPNNYFLMNNETGEFLGANSTIKSIVYEDSDTKETKIAHNVLIMDVDCFGIEVKFDNNCYDNIYVNDIKEIEF